MKLSEKIKNSIKPTGYIALIAILIIFAMGLSVVISLSLRNIDEIVMSQDSDFSEESFNVAQACAEEGLLRLKRDWNYSSGSLSVNGKSCIINVAGTGIDKAITATSHNLVGGNDYQRKIIITVDNGVNITNWQEQ